jgi:membrane protease YdiL (CAAX protease family)
VRRRAGREGRAPGCGEVTHRQHPPGDFAPPASRGELWGYLAAAIALSVAVFGVHRALGHDAFYGTVTGPLVLWAPALVAMAAAWRRTRGLAILGVGTGAWRWWLVGLVGPVAALLAVDGALAAAGLVVYSGSIRGARVAAGPGEPLRGSRRGARLPRLARRPAMASRYGFRRAALGSSAAWFAWHLPGAIWGGRGRGGRRPSSAWCALGAFAMGFGTALAWLRVRSGSVWPAVIAHAAHNAVLFGILRHSFDDASPAAPWLRGEFGLLLAVIALAVGGLCLWRPPVQAS